MKKFIIKCIILFSLSISLLVMSSCGSNTAESSASTKAVSSKLKGDFVFYEKDNATFYTNCDDIVETKLIDSSVSIIYLDEKRKSIIYVSNGNIYIKPTKTDSESIKIDYTNSVLPIIDNKYIVYANGRLFLYDIDSKKKTAISDNDVSNYINYSGKITYIESVSNKQYNLCTYDIKSKKKEITELTEGFYNSNCKISNGVAYYYISGKENNGTRDMTLYKAVVGKKPEVIDSFVSEVRHYNDKVGEDRTSSLYFNLYNSFNDGGLYYRKDISFTDFNTEYYSWNKESNYYYYDGKTSTLLNNIKYITDKSGVEIIDNFVGYNGSSNFWFNNNKDNSITSCSIKSDTNSSKSGFLVGAKLYEGDIKGVSKDCNLVAYDKKVGDSYNDYESYVLNIKSGSNDKLNSRIDKVLYFDNNNFLYKAYNSDMILNNEVIDYNMKQDRCEHNENLSVIGYMTNSGLCIYKDNQANVVSSNASGGHLTNNGNAYYVSDNNLYLYVNGESELITSNVERVYDSWYSVPGYKILR